MLHELGAGLRRQLGLDFGAQQTLLHTLLHLLDLARDLLHDGEFVALQLHERQLDDAEGKVI